MDPYQRREPLPRDLRELIDLLERLQTFIRPGQVPEVTVCQVNILLVLDRTHPRLPSELALERGTSRSAISQALRRLETAGLIERRRHPKDRRLVEVRLTEEGERLKRWPATVDGERARELAERLGPVRYGAKRWLRTTVEAAEGRDFYEERYGA